MDYKGYVIKEVSDGFQVLKVEFTSWAGAIEIPVTTRSTLAEAQEYIDAMTAPQPSPPKPEIKYEDKEAIYGKYRIIGRGSFYPEGMSIGSGWAWEIAIWKYNDVTKLYTDEVTTQSAISWEDGLAFAKSTVDAWESMTANPPIVDGGETPPPPQPPIKPPTPAQPPIGGSGVPPDNRGSFPKRLASYFGKENGAFIQVHMRKLRDTFISPELHKKIHPLV